MRFVRVMALPPLGDSALPGKTKGAVSLVHENDALACCATAPLAGGGKRGYAVVLGCNARLYCN